MKHHDDDIYWMMVWRRFYRHTLGKIAFYVVIVFCLVGAYAPFLASSKPFVVQYDGEWFFPLFRYLFYRGFFTKRLDIFFNILIITLPLFLLSFVCFRRRRRWLFTSLTLVACAQVALFLYFAFGPASNPAFNAALTEARQKALRSQFLPSWDFDLEYMSPYAKLNAVLRYQQRLNQQERFEKYQVFFPKSEGRAIPTLYQEELNNAERQLEHLQSVLDKSSPESEAYIYAQALMQYIIDRRQWLASQLLLIHYEVMPPISHFHWEDDAGGSQALNQHLPFWDLTRINRKDLTAALIFGVRISLVVGILAVTLALAIGLPIGALAGYYGGNFDIAVSRMLEIWESMPTFFMLLLVVAITQSKSIFLIITVIGLFGWTSFSRYMRGEFFKQRNLPYIEACRAQGFHDRKIIFSHIFPNAIPPVLTLLPFAVMGAVTSEAGLSFLGLGEEGSCSWGVLMDEGRTAFPGESYLLWPPAILLTLLLIAIAMVGDFFRDALDPKS